MALTGTITTFTDDNFEWTNVLIPNALLRTYSGYGGHDLSIDGALAADNIMMTGVWLIDRISGFNTVELMVWAFGVALCLAAAAFLREVGQSVYCQGALWFLMLVLAMRTARS